MIFLCDRLFDPYSENTHIKFASLTFLALIYRLECWIPKQVGHIVPCGKFHRIGGAPPETFSSEKYDAPEEVGGDRKSFDSPIRK